MPARPASPVPMPKTRNQMRPMSKPSARTIIGSREPARMTSPTLVFSRNSQRPTSTTAVTAMTKSRYVGKYVKPRLTAPASAFGGSRVTPILPQMSRATSTSTSDSPKVRSSARRGGEVGHGRLGAPLPRAAARAPPLARRARPPPQQPPLALRLAGLAPLRDPPVLERLFVARPPPLLALDVVVGRALAERV